MQKEKAQFLRHVLGSNSGVKTCTQIFYLRQSMCAKSLQSCPTLCDLMNHSPPDSSVHEILQIIILVWVAISFSRKSYQPQGSNPSLLRLLHWQVGCLPLCGK